MKPMNLLIVMTFIFTFNSCGYSARILFAIFPMRSHLIEALGVAETLKSRGHDIFIFENDDLSAMTSHSGFNVIRVDSPSLNSDEITELRFNHQNSYFKMVQDARFTQIWAAACQSMSSDSVLEKIRSLRIDFVVVEGLIIALCGYAIPDRLKIPHISASVTPSFFFMRSAVLSYQSPHAVSSLLWRSGAGFLPRAFNFVVGLTFDSLALEMFPHHHDVRKLLPSGSFDAVSQTSKAHFLYQIPQMDVVNPLMPHVFWAARATTTLSDGINASLPNDLQRFMDNAVAGAIVMSFGSQIPSLPADVLSKFLESFRLTGYHVVMRYSGSEEQRFPTTVKGVKWLPQSQLLAHPNTKLFITHSGNNGQMEGFANAVPMLCFYICCDQKYNAERVVARGYGLMMDIFALDSHVLTANIQQLINNSTLKQHLRRHSDAWKRHARYSTLAADVVEAALLNETDHLIPRDYKNINILQFYQIDIILAIFIIPFVIIFAVCLMY